MVGSCETSGTAGNSTLYYLHSDYSSASLRAGLGSTSLVTNASGGVVSQQSYFAYGRIRANGNFPTDIGFTAKRNNAGIGLMDFRARMYSGVLGRFISADSIVPGAGNPQALNRYMFVLGNPVKYTDPSGHMAVGDTNEAGCMTPGSPACILDKYYDVSTRNAWLESLELYYYQKAYPEYDANNDPYLDGPRKALVAAPMMRGACRDGSVAACAGMAFISGLGAVTGPTAYVSRAEQRDPLGYNARDIVGDPDCTGCGYIKPYQSANDILMPGGKPIGMKQGDNEGYLTIKTRQEMQGIFDALTIDAKPITKPNYTGQAYLLPDGGEVGWRVSRKYGPTIDVWIDNIPIEKLHLPKK